MLLQFNVTTIFIGVLSLVPVAIYPFMKRITYWPQLFLGVAFNWGALVGYTSLAGQLHLPALALYGAGIFWTLGYDTIYAHQDREDDALVGVKSSALKLGERTRPAILFFYVVSLACLALAGAWAVSACCFGPGWQLRAGNWPCKFIGWILTILRVACRFSRATGMPALSLQVLLFWVFSKRHAALETPCHAANPVKG